MDQKIPAYIPAGSDPNKVDPLCQAAGVENKALIPLAGRPIISYVLEALDKAERIESITIVGLDEKQIDIQTEKSLNFIPSSGTNFDTAMKAVNYFTSLQNPPQYVLSLSSDIPFITHEIIDRNINLAEKIGKKFEKKTGKPIELFYPFVPKKIVEKRFPQATKRFRKFTEGVFATGDFFVYSPQAALKPEAQQVAHAIMKNRKNILKILGGFSLIAIFKYLFGRLSLETDVKPTLKRVMNIELETLISKDPEICVDLDYPEDLEKFEYLIKALQLSEA
ncbi:MAG: hypothetical protein D6732_29240 [Methanobacteriota archaeon]|nr:MAG: hypothetical protein D6732_29240 [Euryarchaeota archaeon]